METHIDAAHTQYAAIQIVHSDTTTERFVLAYECERALRELLAEPSIIATGLASREEAEQRCLGGETPPQGISDCGTTPLN